MQVILSYPVLSTFSSWSLIGNGRCWNMMEKRHKILKRWWSRSPSARSLGGSFLSQQQAVSPEKGLGRHRMGRLFGPRQQSACLSTPRLLSPSSIPTQFRGSVCPWLAHPLLSSGKRRRGGRSMLTQSQLFLSSRNSVDTSLVLEGLSFGNHGII